MKKEVGPAAMALAALVIVAILIFVGIKVFGKSGPSNSNVPDKNKALHDQYLKTGQYPSQQGQTRPSPNVVAPSSGQ